MVQQITAGLFDLRSELVAGRGRAIDAVPREVQASIHSGVDTALSGAGFTRTQVRTILGRVDEIRDIGTSVFTKMVRL